MRTFVLGLLFLAYALGEDSLTITASRSITLQPDQAVFGVYVTSPLNTDLNDVLGALAESGITADNFSNLSSSRTSTGNGNNPQYVATLNWRFILNVPFSRLKDTTGMLTALQQSIELNNSGLKLSYSGFGSTVSQQLQASQLCTTSDLIADAKAQAQKLANAAGATVGPVLALSDGSYGGTFTQSFGYAAAVIFDPFTGGASFGSISSAFYNPVSCTIVAKFSLLRP